MRTITALFISVILLFSCENTVGTNVDNGLLESKSAKAIVEANNNFAFDFIKEVHKNETDSNYMISPVSLSLALGMAYNGADGETKAAFEDMMYYQNLPDGVNAFNKQLIEELSSSDDGSVMEIANSIWANESFPVKQDFLSVNREYYSAEVDNMDFSDPATLLAINSWVNEKTHEKIPTILNEISPDAVLYLINALYFNANWKYAFDEENTKLAYFKTEKGERLEVDKMMMTEELAYLKNDLFASVQLPYEKDKFVMTILLPANGKTTDDIVGVLATEKWSQWQDDYAESQEVTVSLPKFKAAYENNLNDELIELGLGVAFNSGLADFSKISDVRTFISFVLQKTYIDVDEEGTEAAAVTVIGIETTSLPSEPQPINFDVNKPFLYFITDKLTGSICFVGRVSTPRYVE